MNRLLAALVALTLSAAPSFAATLISTASGNIDATGTWSLVDTTGTNAYLNSETANTALTTSGVASSSFTPAASTLSAIGVKLASVAAAPSGTLTVKLANSTSPGSRECTITVNVSDLPSTNSAPTAATADGGWVILACAASPNGTDAYTITASTSVAAQVNLFSLATTNWSRLLVTSGTQVNGPAAGDKFIVAGVLTGIGTRNSYAVTIETTSLVNYGNVANTLIDPSISVCQYGTLQFATAASTAYVSEFAGPMVVYNGGTFSVGSSGAPVPASSSATLTLNSTATGDTGITLRNGATMNAAGSSGGRSVVKAKLAATATGGTTSNLTTDVATGWLSGDQIYVAGTAAPSGGYKGDAGTLSGNASGTAVPLSVAVTNTHRADTLTSSGAQTGVAYSMNLFADVILLNRNVVIQGSGSSGNGYLLFNANSVAALSWVQFSQISGSVVGKLGVEVETGPSGSFSLTYFSFTNTTLGTLNLAASNTNTGGTSAAPLLIQYGSFYNAVNTSSASSPLYALSINTAGSLQVYNPFWKIDSVTCIQCGTNTVNARPVFMGAMGGTFTNISITGSGNNGIAALTLSPPYSGIGAQIGGGVGNVWGPITLYTNLSQYDTTAGTYPPSGKIAGLYMWRSARFQFQSANLTIDPFYNISGGFGVYNTGAANLTLRNGIIAWESGITQTPIVTSDAQLGSLLNLDNMEFCNNGTYGTLTLIGCLSTGAIISMQQDSTLGGSDTPGNMHINLRNSSILGAPANAYPFQGTQQGYYSPNAYIVQDCALCSPVKHIAWVLGGSISYDTAISHASGYSARMTPYIMTWPGYISGTVLTNTTPSLWANQRPGTSLFSNGSGFVPGTVMTGGSSPTANVSISQTVGSSASPVQFQSYNSYGSGSGALPRMQSAPYGMGTKVAVASGVSNAQACAWIRPSINTDAAPPWGGSAVTYNGDAPRMVVRQNPYMGVQSDTVIGTSSPTAGAWSQFCATLPTAPADGQFEVVIDADQTFTSNAGGSVNIAEWSCTNCGSVNGSQYWWNGTPADAVTPASTGGGLLVNPGMRGGMN